MEAAAPPTDAVVQQSGADEMEATGSSSVAKPASKVVAPEPKVKPVVDREKQCPFLLRIFARNNSHHRVEDFWYDRLPVEDELQIYTWRDASLKELATLVKEVNMMARRRDMSISFRLLKLDVGGRYTSRDLGVVFNARSTEDDNKTLEDVGFVTGDYIDVAIRREGAPEELTRGRDRDHRNRGRIDNDLERDRTRANWSRPRGRRGDQ